MPMWGGAFGPFSNYDGGSTIAVVEPLFVQVSATFVSPLKISLTRAGPAKVNAV